MKHRLRETIHPVITVLIQATVLTCGAICCALSAMGIVMFVAARMRLLDPDTAFPFAPIVGCIAAVIIIPALQHLIFQKELGPTYGINYAKHYWLTDQYVLPHVTVLEYYKDNEYSLTFAMAYTYAEIERAFDHLRRKHKVYHAFPKLVLPGTSCCVSMALSRRTIEMLLSEMEEDQLVVLETVLYGSGIISAEGEDSLHYISLADTKALKRQLADTRAHSISVLTEPGQEKAVDRRYLNLCQKLLHGPQELIILPPRELA